MLKKIQKKKIASDQIKWIKNYNSIKKGPIVFFGNEFFDAIPIKQFKIKNKKFLEKCYFLKRNTLMETYKQASSIDISHIKSFDTLKKQSLLNSLNLVLLNLIK